MIEISSLTKRYGGATVVDDVSFGCAPGTVTGFLGPNGSGKSTTLKILTGLARADAGTATIDGAPYRALAEPAHTVGVMLDASAQHAGRTGREVLRLAASVIGVPRQRADEPFERVGLPPAAARKRVGTYSLGMRQRLALAHALLGDPQVLVLDEPANGLDPEGVLWMRGLLRDHADRGGTVLLSSHLIHEIELIADQVVVLSTGRVVAQGSVSAMTGGEAGRLEGRFHQLTNPGGAR